MNIYIYIYLSLVDQTIGLRLGGNKVRKGFDWEAFFPKISTSAFILETDVAKEREGRKEK